MVWRFLATASTGKHVLPMVWMMVLIRRRSFFAVDTIKPDLRHMVRMMVFTMVTG